MTTLTKSDKAALIHKVLFDAFDHRFLALNKEIRQSVQSAMAKDHPKFLSLVANDETRKYISSQRVSCFVFKARYLDSDCAVIKPFDYSQSFEKEVYCRSLLRNANVQVIGDCDMLVPSQIGCYALVGGVAIDSYYEIHADLGAAKEKLSALLGAYRLREKFEKDFPELAQFLPAIPVKIAMPAIIIADVLADLAAAGIPFKPTVE